MTQLIPPTTHPHTCRRTALLIACLLLTCAATSCCYLRMCRRCSKATMRIDYYISRVLHQLSFSVLVGAAVLDFFGAVTLETKAQKKLMIWSGIAVLFSGLYKCVLLAACCELPPRSPPLTHPCPHSAGAARPSRMGPAAKLYRMIVYGVKIPLYLALTPLPEKLGMPPNPPSVTLGIVVTIVMLASFTKFYREDQLALVAKTSAAAADKAK